MNLMPMVPPQVLLQPHRLLQLHQLMAHAAMASRSNKNTSFLISHVEKGRKYVVGLSIKDSLGKSFQTLLQQ